MLDNLHIRFTSYLHRHPELFRTYFSLHGKVKHLLVRPDSEIVIEGFPRCANSFAVLAFEYAQKRPVKVAHHLHSQSQVVLGVRYGIPVIVLIREPVSALASILTRRPEISLDGILAQYIRFYRTVEQIRDHVVLADFREVTSAFAAVIEQVNSKYGTSFLPYTNSESQDSAIFARIDRLNREREGGQLNQLARPSKEKSPLLAAYRAQIELDPKIGEAKLIYQRLLSAPASHAHG